MKNSIVKRDFENIESMASKHLNKVIKIQAHVRGHLQRLRHLQSQPKTSNTLLTAKPISKIPDFSNITTRITESRMPPFVFEEVETNEKVNEKGPHMLQDGTVYVGEWSKKGRRHGKGT